MKLTPEEAQVWRDSGYEASFLVIDPESAMPESPAPGLWAVMDAECEFIGFCRTEEKARLIVTALNAYDEAAFLVDLPEHHA